VAREEVLADGHCLLCEAVAVVAELVEVETVGVTADRAAEEVGAVLCGAVRCAKQLAFEPGAVHCADAGCCLVVALVCDVARDRGALGAVCVVDGPRVDDKLDNVSVLAKVLVASEHLHGAICRFWRHGSVRAAAEEPQRDVCHIHQVALHHTDVHQLFARLQLCCAHGRGLALSAASALLLPLALLCCARCSLPSCCCCCCCCCSRRCGNRVERVVLLVVWRPALRAQPIQLLLDVVPAEPAHLFAHVFVRVQTRAESGNWESVVHT